MAVDTRPVDFATWTDIAAGSTNEFTLYAGLFGLTLTSTWGGGNAVLQRYLPESQTWIAVMAAFTVDGYATAYLPAGRYRLTVTTATHTYGRIEKIFSGLKA